MRKLFSIGNEFTGFVVKCLRLDYVSRLLSTKSVQSNVLLAKQTHTRKIKSLIAHLPNP